jgi:uncharacterized protein
VVDRPHDRHRPSRDSDAATAATHEIDPGDVIAYLRRNPDFLETHPEALPLLHPPPRDSGGGVADFQHFLLDRLRRDSARLAAGHRTLLATSRGNLASQNRVHKAVLAILAAASFEQLLLIATTDLAVLLDVDVVTIAVESAAAPSARLRTQGIHLLKAGEVELRLGGERGVALATDIRGDPVLFGGAAGLVRSQALLRLSFGSSAPPGLLCVGTRKPGNFHAGLGTELLSFLAQVLGLTIRQWLDPGH